MKVSISRHRWEMLNELQQSKIKFIVKNYSTDMGYDHNYEYYWIEFSKEQYLLAELAGFNNALGSYL
jgi:hypothetical protein